MTDQPIPVGQRAPDFTLEATGDKTPVSLAELRGKTVVLLFYVLDFTGI